MPKVTLDLNDFKTLASGVRLDIIKTLDGKKMSLNELESVTKLHKMTLYEHLSKLIETGYVNKIEREGHKWVYYKLSWKGDSLIHPENTNVVIFFSITFITLLFGIIGLINIVQSILSSQISQATSKGYNSPSKGFFLGINPLILIFTIICLILFIIFMIISIRKYKKNKIPKL